MKHLLRSCWYTLLSLALVLPTVVQADLVPCTDDCTFASFLGPEGLIGKIVHFLLFSLAVPLAAIAFAWAGILMVVNWDNDDKRRKAKEIIWAAIWGLALALAAWLIVNTIFTTLTTIKISP